jgi:hypothetical protein
MAELAAHLEHRRTVARMPAVRDPRRTDQAEVVEEPLAFDQRKPGQVLALQVST